MHILIHQLLLIISLEPQLGSLYMICSTKLAVNLAKHWAFFSIQTGQNRQTTEQPWAVDCFVNVYPWVHAGIDDSVFHLTIAALTSGSGSCLKAVRSCSTRTERKERMCVCVSKSDETELKIPRCTEEILQNHIQQWAHNQSFHWSPICSSVSFLIHILPGFFFRP